MAWTEKKKNPYNILAEKHEKNHLEDSDIEGRVLKRILKNKMGVDWVQLEQDTDH